MTTNRTIAALALFAAIVIVGGNAPANADGGTAATDCTAATCPALPPLPPDCTAATCPSVPPGDCTAANPCDCTAASPCPPASKHGRKHHRRHGHRH